MKTLSVSEAKMKLSALVEEVHVRLGFVEDPVARGVGVVAHLLLHALQLPGIPGLHGDSDRPNVNVRRNFFSNVERDA